MIYHFISLVSAPPFSVINTAILAFVINLHLVLGEKGEVGRDWILWSEWPIFVVNEHDKDDKFLTVSSF